MSATHPYRLSDAERDEAISALADAYADGRLTAAEFDERMAAASAARFAADLDGLFSDLPPRPATPVPVAAPQRRPERRRTAFPLMLVPIAAVLAVLAIIGMPWFLLPMVFFWFAWGGPRRALWQQQPGYPRRCGRW